MLSIRSSISERAVTVADLLLCELNIANSPTTSPFPIGLTRGSDTRFHHSEKLDKGEVMIAQFTEHTSAIKIRGKAQIQTGIGEIESDSRK